MSKEPEQLFRQHDTSIDTDRRGLLQTDRRSLLQTLAAAGLVTGVGAGTATAGPGDSGDTQGNGGTDEKPQCGRDLFVDPDDGNDDWEGNQPEPVGQGKNGNGPLKTVQTAIDRAREWANRDDRDTVNVWFREGRYNLDEAAVVEPYDEETAINLFSYPDEQPVLDGGRRITGWEETEVNGVDAWVADVPDVASGDWYFRQLFVNDERRQRARLPKGDNPRRDNLAYKGAPGQPSGFVAHVDELVLPGVTGGLEASVRRRTFALPDMRYERVDSGTNDQLVANVTRRGDPRGFEGFIGAAFTAEEQLEVSELGRAVAPGNDQVHEVKIERLHDGKEVASANIDTSEGQAGEFEYTELSAPVTLQSNTIYVIASEEFSGDDLYGDSRYQAGGGTTHNGPAIFRGGDEFRGKDLINGWQVNKVNEVEGIDFEFTEDNFRPADAEMVQTHRWLTERYPIESVDFSGQDPVIKTAVKSVLGPGGFGPELDGVFFENVFGALSEPGEWYLNRKDGRVYYIPKEGEQPSDVEIVAPEPVQLLQIKGCVPGLQIHGGGTTGGCTGEIQFVTDLTVRGLIFQHARWTHVGLNPELGISWDRPVQNPAGRTGSSQGSQHVPGAVEFEGAKNCTLEHCTIQRVGGYGIELYAGSKSNQINYNRLRDVGAGGLKETGGRVPTDQFQGRGLDGFVDIEQADEPETFTEGNEITDNYITEIGRVYFDGIGIYSMHAANSVYAHNHIEDLYNIAINIGFINFDSPSEIKNHLVEKNKLHGFREWTDTGPIHVLGRQPGTVFRGNYLFDQATTQAAGSKGVYLDGGASEVTVAENVVDSEGAKFALPLPFNGEGVTAENNIFVGGKNMSIGNGRNHERWTLRRNIILMEGRRYWKNVPTLDSADTNTANQQVLWDLQDGADITVGGGVSFEEWQNAGFDTDSIVADPKFEDLANNDFGLQDDSPAFDVGFEPIDLSDVGVRGGDDSTGSGKTDETSQEPNVCDVKQNIDTVFTQNGDLKSVSGNERNVAEHSQTNVSAIAASKADFDGDERSEIPILESGDEIRLIDGVSGPDGAIDISPEARTNNTHLTTGRFDGSATSIFYIANGEIYRANPEESSIKIATPDNGASAVAGVRDIDGDSTSELVFVDGSQQLRYVEPDDDEAQTFTKIPNGGVGSNSGIGVGAPADFTGDGKADVPIVDGNNQIRLLGPEGVRERLITGNDDEQAAKAPVSANDVDGDGELELVYLENNNSPAELKYVDDVGGDSSFEVLKDANGEKIQADTARGVTSLNQEM